MRISQRHSGRCLNAYYQASDNEPDTAQLASVPTNAGSAQLQQVLDEIKVEIPGAQYLNSSDYASLNPGYWVVYYNGPFDDGNQALRYCASRGRATKISASAGSLATICETSPIFVSL